MTATGIKGSAKDAMLREALRLFASRGVEAVSVRDIAAATGFSNPALFRHFASKEALAEALFAQCYGGLVEALGAAADKEGLQPWLAAVLAEIDRLPEAVLFVLDNLKRYWHSLPDALKAQNLPKLAATMIARERRAGRMRADVPTPLIATVLFGTLGQVARSVHFRETEIDPQAYAAALADLLGRGLGAANPAKGDEP